MSASAGPTIDYLGHAGFVFEHRGCRVLIDPWFYPAFARSWFPFPDNRFLLATLEQDFDFLYISHAHEDHLDRTALQRVSRRTPVLCPAFRSRSLQRELNALGFEDFRVLGHGEQLDLGPGLRATMILDTSHKEDSGLLLDADGWRFLDLNDCHPQMSEIPRRVDLLAAQFSGAMWYPNCYDYGEDERQAKVDAVRANLVDTLVRLCLAADARHYLPSAGPACFLDPALWDYNDPYSTIFARWADVEPSFVAAGPGTEVVRAEPGARIEVGRTAVSVVGPPARPPEDLASYARRRRAEYQAPPVGPAVDAADLHAHFADLQRRNRPFVERDFDKRFVVRSEGDAWTITVGAYPRVAVEPGHAADARYTFDVPAWLLRRIVDGEIGWEEALLSMRIRLRRHPDVFDVRLLGLLRYGARPVQTRQMLVDAGSSDETIVLAGRRCQRYCPHAGEDLTHAIVRDGLIECPRHHWRWDIATGECIEGGTLPLRIEGPEAESA